MHHEDRDAHQTMCEAVDSQADWHAKQMAGLAEAKRTEQWMRDCLDYRSMRPKFMTEDMRTYFGNDPIDYDLQGIEVFRPLTVKELMAKQAKQERAARIVEEAVVVATFITVIVGLMMTPALWHWARALWSAIGR